MDSWHTGQKGRVNATEGRFGAWVGPPCGPPGGGAGCGVQHPDAGAGTIKLATPMPIGAMAIDIVDLALDFIAAYGLIAMFILLVLDGALLLPVFPGEIILIMAVAAYAHDPASLLMLIAVASAAGLLGSLILYSVTRGGGRRLVERYPKFFMMPRRRRERLERIFGRPAGQSLVLFLRLVPLTRILVSIPAGLAKMPLVRFVVLSTIGLGAYHAGFLWLTYEANRPGSTIATQKEQLQDAYASPAWDFVQTNAIVTGALVLALGVVLSARASARMYRAHPEETSGSLIGTLSVAVLTWGGVVLAIATYADVDTLFALAAVGGVDVAATAARFGLGPIQALLAVAAASTLLGLLLGRIRRAARQRHEHRLWTHRVMARVEQREHEGEARRAAGPAAPAPAPTLFSTSHESTVEARPRQESEGEERDWVHEIDAWPPPEADDEAWPEAREEPDQTDEPEQPDDPDEDHDRADEAAEDAKDSAADDASKGVDADEQQR